MRSLSLNLQRVKIKPRGLVRRRNTTGFLYVLPAALFILIFFIIPLVMTFYMSLNDWPLLGQRSFIGLGNYAEMAQDKQFWASLCFTTKYTLLVTPAIFIPAFILAMLVNLSLRGIGIYRTAYFLPVVIGLGVSSLLWHWMLNDRVGIINGILQSLNLTSKSIVLLGDKTLAMYSIIVSIVWKTVGFTMVLLLMGMQAIPEELFQAALVDGAGFWQKMRYITMPLLRRTFALALVISVIGSYLAFDPFYIMTRGGPSNQTITLVYWIVNNSFTYFRMGYGAALSIVLMFILLILSGFQLYVLRKET